MILALGGNLAGSFASQEALFDAVLSRAPCAGLRVVKKSSWWRSAAWPDPRTPDYLNGVLIVETTLPPLEVLGVALKLEAEFGRARSQVNAPRTLDIDLVAYGRRTISSSELILPHPRAHERYFVMGPLAEIAPDWRHPVLDLTARDLAAAAPVGRDARPLEEG